MSNSQSGKLILGAAAAANAAGTEAALSVMRLGGNAVDAALAAAHMMGVVEPLDCGIGAGGFMTIYDSSTNTSEIIDFMGTSPQLAEYQLYSTNDDNGRFVIRVEGQHNQIGHRSIATPGVLRGFEMAHKRYGKLPIQVLLEPAIDKAKNGFPVSYKGALRMRRTTDILSLTSSCKNLYLKSDGNPFKEGEIIKNNDYAKVLEEIGRAGSASFYSGDISKLIVREIENNDGFLTPIDLKNYEAVRKRPAEYIFMGHNVITVPRPSTGALVFSGLKSLTDFPEVKDTQELLVRAMLRMFAERRKSFGDFNDKKGGQITESPETTSLCTLDVEGNAVSLTYSNNNHSGVVIPGTGILMNNQMALFSPWPGNPNEVSGGKRPVSSMMPSILLNGRSVRLILGASGSTRIPTSIMQILYRLLLQEKSLIEAITEPKLHAEAETLSADEDLCETAAPLAKKLGLSYQNSPGRDTSMGVVQAIQLDGGNMVTAIGDPRARGEGLVI